MIPLRTNQKKKLEHILQIYYTFIRIKRIIEIDIGYKYELFR